MLALKKTRNISFAGIFWGWNLIFILTVYLGILPYVGIPLIAATFDGEIALDFCMTFLTLVCIPLGFCYLGFKYFRTKPTKLIRLFYGVEAPLFLWCLVRLFVVRELTLASGLLLGTVLVCVFAYAINLFKQEGKLKINPNIEIVTNTLIFLTGIYLSLVLLFYVIPAAISFILWLGDFTIAFLSFKWIPDFIDFILNGSDIISSLFFISLFFSL